MTASPLSTNILPVTQPCSLLSSLVVVVSLVVDIALRSSYLCSPHIHKAKAQTVKLTQTSIQREPNQVTSTVKQELPVGADNCSLLHAYTIGYPGCYLFQELAAVEYRASLFMFVFKSVVILVVLLYQILLCFFCRCQRISLYLVAQ